MNVLTCGAVNPSVKRTASAEVTKHRIAALNTGATKLARIGITWVYVKVL